MEKRASLSVALAAVALFALEPFVGKVLMPRLGGTPMVWNTCVMVFQALLLGGYWYSVLLSRVVDRRAAARRHLFVVVAASLSWPLTVRALWWSPWPSVPPVVWIVGVVVLATGAPFLMLSATSPLVQVWLARRTARPDAVHRLYAVSNVGSVAGLIAYVALVEPLLGVRAQSWLIWLVGVGAALLALRVAPRDETDRSVAPADAPDQPQPREALRLWFSLSFAASLLLFAVNTYLATDVASFPLLFAIPLTLFLLGFAVGFSMWAERWSRWIAIVALGTGGGALYYVLFVAQPATTILELPLPLLALFTAVTALSTRLAGTRPAAPRLPVFYTAISLGGVAAGGVCVLLLPWIWTPLTTPLHAWSLRLVSSTVPEYPLALVLLFFLAMRHWSTKLLALAALVVACTAPGETYGQQREFEARNFYGTLRVDRDELSSTMRLANGTTLHGFQIIGDRANEPTSYYHHASPLGQLMLAQRPKRVVALGLGTGTLASYAMRGDHYTFLELNPMVVDVAQDSGLFSFLSRATDRGAAVDVRVGDGRLLAAGEPAGSIDVLVLDAFSSDSIPVHLLTLDAFREYAPKMAPRGVMAVHVSNRFFDLGPMVAVSAEALGWRWALQSRTDEEPYETPSTWMMLVRDGPTLTSLQLDQAPWEAPEIPAHVAPWTDDWANLLGRLKVVADRLGTKFDRR